MCATPKPSLFWNFRFNTSDKWHAAEIKKGEWSPTNASKFGAQLSHLPLQVGGQAFKNPKPFITPLQGHLKLFDLALEAVIFSLHQLEPFGGVNGAGMNSSNGARTLQRRARMTRCDGPAHLLYITDQSVETLAVRRRRTKLAEGPQAAKAGNIPATFPMLDGAFGAVHQARQPFLA